MLNIFRLSLGTKSSKGANAKSLNEYEAKVCVRQSMLASLGSSIVTIICTKPFDVARSRRQARPQKAGKKTVAQDIYSEDFKELVNIIRNEGFASLYSNIGTHLLGHVTSGLVYHGAETFLKSHFFDRLPSATSFAGRMAKRILFSALSGFVQVCVTHPIWVVKNREQLRTRSTGKEEKFSPANPLKELYCLAKEEGIQGLYSGFIPSMVLTVHTSFQYALYDEFKIALARAKGRHLTPLDRSVAGIVSKSISMVVANPMHVIRTRLMEKGSVYKGPIDAVCRIVREEGFSALYRGSSVGLYKIMAAGITHPVYDEILIRTKRLF